MKARQRNTGTAGRAGARHESKATFLAHSTLFGHLDTQGIADLDHATTILPCEPGRIFYRPGESAQALFLVREGSIQLYHLSTDGRKLIIATRSTRSIFGEQALINQQQHTHFAEARTKGTVYIIGKTYLEHLLTHDQNLTMHLLHAIIQHSMQLEAQLLDSTFKSTTARLARLLLTLAQRPQMDTDQLSVNGLSHEELADRLGVYRETVSTTLRDLKEQGIIEPRRKQIIIHDSQRLEQISHS